MGQTAGCSAGTTSQQEHRTRRVLHYLKVTLETKTTVDWGYGHSVFARQFVRADPSLSPQEAYRASLQIGPGRQGKGETEKLVDRLVVSCSRPRLLSECLALTLLGVDTYTESDLENRTLQFGAVHRETHHTAGLHSTAEFTKHALQETPFTYFTVAFTSLQLPAGHAVSSLDTPLSRGG